MSKYLIRLNILVQLTKVLYGLYQKQRGKRRSR